ncbi:VCBS domain-containing protein [Pseudodesulfovibrio thermohalotolerans]|uniref:VCBS domain-containing protein n=1 Tax=Pseudodesulfovibrio thermohalotolerans TaxID=2880651 RepID=UPI002441D08A|nr:VCBS domain-containing protein [Pseudodesulfovibrio thermohalotolerans]WFS61565.1 VCBS domain-containing protein [Pseudodesulfovibrio thermohalotolerans]
MTDTSIVQTQVINASLPGAGQTSSYQLTANSLVRFDFDLAEAEFIGNGNNLEITVEGGGRVVLMDYLPLAVAGALPMMEMLDGQQVESGMYLFAFESDRPLTEADMETAAGDAASSSGAGEYNDDPGSLFAGLDALGPQGDAYGSHLFPSIDPPNMDLPEAGLISPVAVSDVNEVVESGTNRDRNNEEPGRPETASGNLLLNDYDDDDIDYPETNGAQTDLSVGTIDFPGTDFTGNNPGPAEVTDAGTQVHGLYGTLTVFSDGSYDYVLDETLADPLRQGQEVQEQFSYTAVDPDGNQSNTATLTITITGTNDAPDAFDDTSDNVVEQGGAVAGIASVSGNVLHNDSDVDNVGYEDLDPSYADLIPTDPDGLIELSVTSIYSYGTHQYEDTPSGGGNFTVEGAYGTLTINADGSYEYTLDQTKADPLNIGDNPVEYFGYSMWDGEKYGYAYLHIPVIGSNDSPVATADSGAFTEAVDDALPADLTGNVLDNDTDVDNADHGDAGAPELTVASVAYSGEGTPPDRASDLYEADHVIEGEYGTLYLNNDGSYHYVEDKSATDPMNSGDPDVTDVFTYVVSDNQPGGALTGSATLTITISGANDSPVAIVDHNAFTEAVDDAAPADVTGNVLANDTDVDNADHGDAGAPELTVASIAYSGEGTPPDRTSDLYEADHVIEGEYGTLYLNNDGSYHYVEDKSATDPMNSGDPDVTDVFTYVVSDNQPGGALTGSATLTITISGANDSPVATVDHNTFTEAVDDALPADLTGNVLDNDTDVDNADHGDAGAPELTVASVAYSGEGTPPDRASDLYEADHVIEGEYGTLYLNNDGSYHYVEDKSATDPMNSGDPDVTDVFTYVVSDNQPGGALTGSATLTITISGANDSPVAIVDHNAFTEAVDDAAPADVTGNVLANDTDVDNADHGDAGAPELTVASVAYSGEGTPPDRASDLYEADHVIEGEYGTLYLNDDGSYHYVEDKSATDPMNSGDPDVTDVFTYVVSDNQPGGALTDSATLTITISGANDSPVAIHDGSHEIFITNTVETVIDDWSGVSGSVYYGPGYIMTAEAFDTEGNPIDDVQFNTWGNNQHLGIYTNGTSDDRRVDDQDGTEQITFEFDEPKESFSIEFIAQGNNQVNAWVYPLGGGEPVLFTNVGNAVYITPGFDFDTIVFIPNGSFGMESLTTVTGGENTITGTAEGNVLANDHDVDNVDFDDAAAGGDMHLMELSVSAIDSSNMPDNSSSTGSDLNGNYHLIDGEFGSLKIYETGQWSYAPHEEVDGDGGWQNLDHSAIDIFQYTVSDVHGGTNTAYIEVSLNVNTTVVMGGGGILPGFLGGTHGNDVLFPADGDTVTSGSGNDAIVIDPLYLGDDHAVVNITDFSDNDRLMLGNMEGTTVDILSNTEDVSLIFSDVDGNEYITVNLVGVSPVHDAVNEVVDITTSDDLNALIQTIIDSGNDSMI